MQDNNLEKDMYNIRVTVSDDELSAYICVMPMEDEEYTLNILLKAVAEERVVYGINEEVLKTILAKKAFHKTVKFAQGTPAVDGKDGWFEFFFEENVETGPRILKDGSVDYSEYGSVPAVVEGQRLIEYHPSVPCQNGVSVRGASILAKKGKDLARLKGKGFIVDDNGINYVAKHDGKVTFIDSRLVVDNELVVEGDVTYNTGDIEFQNDIHVRGNVCTGVCITSQKGSIIVDGYVEQAALYAKNDVVLKNGMQGNGKGKITAGGDVKGKFFEQVNIECNGDVQANAIMNTKIKAGQDIIVSGKYGVIVGGVVCATRYISANIIGNMSEVRTEIRAGADGDLFALLSQYERKKDDNEKAVKDIAAVIEKINAAMEKMNTPELSQKRMQLMRMKIECDTKANEIEKKIQEVLDKMAKANLARVTVNKVVNPGTIISISGVKAIVSEEKHHVEYARRGAGIIVRDIDE